MKSRIDLPTIIEHKEEDDRKLSTHFEHSPLCGFGEGNILRRSEFITRNREKLSQIRTELDDIDKEN